MCKTQSNEWKLSEATVNLKKGKYVVLYDPNDPRNEDDPNGDVRIICVISPADKMDDIDLQNAAIMKEAKNMLVTLLKVRDVLSKGKRGGFAGILAKDTINTINTQLKKIHSR
jgi:hypothetical protein